MKYLLLILLTTNVFATQRWTEVDPDEVRNKQYKHFVDMSQTQDDRAYFKTFLNDLFIGKLTVLPDKLLNGNRSIFTFVGMILSDQPERVWVFKNCKKKAEIARSGNLLIICLWHDNDRYILNDEVMSEYDNAIVELDNVSPDRVLFDGDY